jgi:hypothetical protein
MSLHAQPGFDQPDVFIASAKEAFYASADTDTGFHQVGVGYLLKGEKRRQGLPINWEGFESSTTRWHGLQNTIHNHYTELSSHSPARAGVNCERSHVTEPDLQRQAEYSPEYSEDGVDLSLIRWMLSLTPAERLQFLQRQVNAILAIRKLNAG